MNELDPDQSALVLALANALRARGWRLATAESCTGGLIAAACTSVAGSSDWFECGVVSYSNDAKTELLGVSATLIEQHGAVSEAVATAMALGALQRSQAQRAVAVTGIAGPGGGTLFKPVGTVWLAVARRDSPAVGIEVQATVLHLASDRAAVRHATVTHALQALIASL